MSAVAHRRAVSSAKSIEETNIPAPGRTSADLDLVLLKQLGIPKDFAHEVRDLARQIRRNRIADLDILGRPVA